MYPSAESDTDVGGSEDVERPLVGGARTRAAEGLKWKGVLPRVAGLAGLAVVAWVGTASVARSRFGGAAAEPAVAETLARGVVDLQEVAPSASASVKGTCKDTPSWTNGFYECATNGYKGKGCEPRGLNCQAYQENGWCTNGITIERYKDWAFGQHMNYPELNCCACGGGSGPSVQSGSILAAGGASAPVPVPTLPRPSPPVPSPLAAGARPGTASCSANPACTKAGLSGNCCPNDDNVQLECCSVPAAGPAVAPSLETVGGNLIAGKVCEDTAQWANGYIKCNTLGLTRDDGCTFGGMSCDGYVKQGFCASGQAVKGKEWATGGAYNHPELNCCACGKASAPK